MKRITSWLSGAVRFSYPLALMAVFVVVLPLVGAPALATWRDLPEDLPEVSIAGKNTILDKNGDVIAETWTQGREKLDNLDKVSPHAVDALISTEDSRFYDNAGFDVKGTVRSAVSGSGGGSGITQQLVKNLLFFDLAGDSKESATEQTLMRKIRELKLAMNYDKKHSKDDILLEYFNTVAFGAPSMYGIESASQYFFAKPARDLNIAQAAVLVGSVQNPSLYNLDSREPEDVARFTARKNDVLGRMLSQGNISQQEYDDAVAEELVFAYKRQDGGTCAQGTSPFFCEYVLDYIKNSPRYGETREAREMLLAKGGMTIKTTLDPEVEKIVRDQLVRDYGDTNRIAVPTAIVEPGTGKVIATATNRSYGDNVNEGQTLIDLANVPMGTGSVFKLITLAAAINDGYNRNNLTLTSQCPLYTPGYDSPPGGFKNSNSCALQGGTLDYKRATAFSSNTWYVTLEKTIGVDKVKQFANSVGLTAPDFITPQSLSYTLGTTEHSAISMAAAFATFAADGTYCPATPIDSITYDDGTAPVAPDTYDGSSDKCRSVISPQGASIVNEAMRSNVSGEIPGAFGINFKVPGYDTAGKSGTNEMQNSSWVQMSGNYVLYNNAFDPETSANGIETLYYKGSLANWGEHVVGLTGRDTLKQIFDAKGYKPLNYSNTSTELKPNVADQSNFFAVPNVIGSSPESAAGVFAGLGIDVIVNKEKAPKPTPETPSGVVVSQSLEPGMLLSRGTQRKLELTVSQ